MESQSCAVKHYLLILNSHIHGEIHINHSNKNIVILSEKRIITQLISKVESVTSEQELVNEC